MAIITQDSGQFEKLVGKYETPILEYWKDKFADNIKDSMIPELFDEARSTNFAEAIGEMTGAVDFTQWNGQFTYTAAKEGNTKVFTPIVWQAGRAFDRFTLSNAKLLDMKRDVSVFARGAARLREAIAAGMFMNAASTEFTVNGVPIANTVGNGLALGSAAHTSVNYGTNQGNLGTNVLNAENLESAIQAMVEYKDEDGKDCNLQPDTLVVPFALRSTALELIGGPGKYDVADNNPNIYYGNMRVIVWKQFRKLSSATGHPWFVCDSEAMKESFKWINRLESGDMYDLISFKDEETQTWKVGSIMWFSAGAYDWRSCYINIPA